MAKTPFGAVQGKLEVMGKAIEGAIATIAGRDNPYVYFLLVLDPTTGKIAWSSDCEKEEMKTALSLFLSKQAH